MFERWRKSGTYVHGGGGGGALDANFLVAWAPLLRVACLSLCVCVFLCLCVFVCVFEKAGPWMPTFWWPGHRYSELHHSVCV